MFDLYIDILTIIVYRCTHGLLDVWFVYNGFDVLATHVRIKTNARRWPSHVRTCKTSRSCKNLKHIRKLLFDPSFCMCGSLFRHLNNMHMCFGIEKSTTFVVVLIINIKELENGTIIASTILVSTFERGSLTRKVVTIFQI
mgnify:CR=1 FL=1